MKILIDPMLAVLAKDLSTEEKAELLMCVLEYPNRDCGLGLWKYMKQQIDMDAQKYREKCDRIAASRQNRHPVKSTMKSDMNSDLFSAVKKEESKENKTKENCNCKESERSNALANVENDVENFLITNDFSLSTMGKENPKLGAYLSIYLPAIIAQAEKTLVKKRTGQLLNIKQIVDWIEQERAFYAQNHGGKS